HFDLRGFYNVLICSAFVLVQQQACNRESIVNGPADGVDTPLPHARCAIRSETSPEGMMTQAEKARRFRALHERNKLLVIPNPWDAASAKLLASLGFEALTTTSAGTAFQLGRPDGEGKVSRAE